MSTPEIFRRCTACGASFSASALFCPQCGNPTQRGNSEAEPGKDGELNFAMQHDDRAVEISSGAETAGSDAGAPDSSQPREELPHAAMDAGSVATTTALDESSAFPTQSAAAANPGPDLVKQRAGNVERRIRPRVDKLRKGTSIVIDEAAYDPSLRFVLIAGVLFLLFLGLLLLSKWIG